MFEQVTLKENTISEKAIHLSIQKAHSHKQGNNHSLDRSEVAGSGKKLFKQKGTGNARAGNKKTTQRRGGGKAFGPKFHKYEEAKEAIDAGIAQSIKNEYELETAIKQLIDQRSQSKNDALAFISEKKGANKMIINAINDTI